MFGAAISLVAAFFLVDHAHEARLLAVEPGTANIGAA
jgi:hypothetical protein